MKIKIICKNCKKEFNVYPSRVEQDKLDEESVIKTIKGGENER
jgi:hypothetical protein